MSDALPCGEDLEYAEDFQALTRAVQGKPEQQYGDTIIPAEKPDWRDVERLADALMSQTKDLRACVVLTRALTQNHGLHGLAGGLELIHALLDQYWNDLHPQLIIDGENDPYVRINAIADLTDSAGLIRDIRNAVLIKSPVGSILVKEAESALENGQSDSGVSRQQLIAASADALQSPQSPLFSVAAARHALDQISAVCKEKFGHEQAPDLEALTALLSRLGTLLTGNASAGLDPNDGGHGEVDSQISGGITGASGAFTKINSRQDVVRLLDLVCQYIEETEPTNPAPLLIKRAQRLMVLDFMGIMREMSPDSINQIELITGIRHD